MSLAKYKEAMKREQDRLNNEIDDLNRKLNIQRQNFEEVEKKKTELDTKNKELYKILDVRRKRRRVFKHNEIFNISILFYIFGGRYRFDNYPVHHVIVCVIGCNRKHRAMLSKKSVFWIN